MSGALLVGLVVVLICILGIVYGYSIQRLPSVIVASAAPPAANPAPVVAVSTPAAAAEHMSASPYDYDPATLALLQMKMRADPGMSKRERMASMMRGGNNENPKLVSLLGSRRGM
jgi:3-oxoacyl-ACP reductase-like protein